MCLPYGTIAGAKSIKGCKGGCVGDAYGQMITKRGSDSELQI